MNGDMAGWIPPGLPMPGAPPPPIWGTTPPDAMANVSQMQMQMPTTYAPNINPATGFAFSLTTCALPASIPHHNTFDPISPETGPDSDSEPDPDCAVIAGLDGEQRDPFPDLHRTGVSKKRVRRMERIRKWKTLKSEAKLKRQSDDKMLD